MAEEAGWRTDPTGRHELRYHDGSSWTDHVADGGEQAEDPYLPPTSDGSPEAPRDPSSAVAVPRAAAAAPNAALDHTEQLPPSVRARQTPGAPGPHYNAFISYSHAADGVFAPALQRALQTMGKSWRQRRALNVFRDQTGLSVNPNLWTSIAEAMDGSEWFVLLASPEAARSEWVGLEIERWLEEKSVDRLLPVVTDGSWTWHPETADFAWHDPDLVTAVHPRLRGVFKEEPRHMDMSWAKGDLELTLRNPRFRDQIAELAAPMHGLRKDELEGEDIRQQRRTHRLARGAVSILVALTVAALCATVLAVVNQREAAAQRDRAEQERDRAVSQALAGRSQAFTGNRLDEQMLQAAEALAVDATPEAEAAVVSATIAARYVDRYHHGFRRGAAGAALHEEAGLVAVRDASGTITVLDNETREVVGAPFTAPPPPVYGVETNGQGLLFLDGGRTLAVASTGSIHFYEVATGTELRDLPAGTSPMLDRRGFAVAPSSASGPFGAVTMTDLATGSTVEYASLPSAVYHLPITSTDGRVLIVSPTYPQDRPFGSTTPLTLQITDPVDGRLVASASFEDVPTTPVSPVGAQTGAGPDIIEYDVGPDDSLVVLGRHTVWIRTAEGSTSFDLPAGAGEIAAGAVAPGAVVVATYAGAVYVHHVGTPGVEHAGGIDGRALVMAGDASASRIVVAGKDESVLVLDPAGGQLGTSQPAVLATCPGRCLAVSDDGRGAVATDSGEVASGPLDTDGWERVAVTEATGIAIAATGGRVAAGNATGTITVLDGTEVELRMDEGRIEQTSYRNFDPAVVGLAFDPSGRFLAAGNLLLDLETGQIAESSGDPAQVIANSFSDTGDVLVTTWEYTGPRDRASGNPRGHSVVLRSLVDPDDECSWPDRWGSGCGAPPLVAPAGPTIGLWTGGPEPEDLLLNVATTGSGNALWVGTDGGVVLRYQIERYDSSALRAELTERISAGNENIVDLAELRGGRLLVVTTPSEVRIYDRMLGTDLGTLWAGNDLGMARASVSPNGSALLVGSPGERPVHIDLDPEALVERLCATAGRSLSAEQRAALGAPTSTVPACGNHPTFDRELRDGALQKVAIDPPSEDEAEDAPQGAPTLEAALQEALGPDYLGACDTISPAAASGTVLCANEVTVTEEEGVFLFGYPQSYSLGYLRFQRGGDGTWSKTDIYNVPFEGEVAEPEPEWLVRALEQAGAD